MLTDEWQMESFELVLGVAKLGLLGVRVGWRSKFRHG